MKSSRPKHLHQPVDSSEGDVNLSPERQKWINSLDSATRKLLDQDAEFFLHQSLSTPCLDVLTQARGSGFTDLNSKTFLDFHGNSAHQVGHAHPKVIEAVKAQLDTLAFCPRRFTNEPAIRLAEKLVSLAPGDLGKVLFAPGGTSAVGMALKLARMATGRFKTISMWDSFHGASLDAISLGGEALFRNQIGPLLPGTEHVPPAEPYRCMWNPDGSCESCDLRCAKYIEYVLEREGDVAAVVAEPFRCTTINIPPQGYWPYVRKACDKHGALLVFDETALCLGRAGTMFAFENFGVVPDIVTLGKGLGGGVFPLAAIVARKDLDIAPHVALGHYTHEKNPTACAAGLAAIEVIEQEGLLARARVLGRETLGKLAALGDKHPCVGQARGLGLAMGLEIVQERHPSEPDPARAERILYSCLKQGLSFKVSGGSCLTLTPPLTLSGQDMDLALAILEQAVIDTENTA
ncbi:MAG: aspartate aminotransferase family protein [Desulfovibrio sp.]|nr:MAG: aspartate aminotransferase family protein [Desulfovibrio sp.]